MAFFDKWKISSRKIKTAVIMQIIATIVGFVGTVIYLVILSQNINLNEIIGFMLPIMIVVYGIEIIVIFGLFQIYNWARKLGVWWGFLSLLHIISLFALSNSGGLTSDIFGVLFQNEGVFIYFIPYILQILAGLFLMGVKKDFKLMRGK